jgi:CRISPR system Cascade subunit CasE
MTPLWLTRARLKDAPSVAALARLLVPADANEQVAAAHRLVWALFSDGAERRRDFLWRQDKPGEFVALSTRPPNALDDIFTVESKAFEPALVVGDRLQFRLHANPVISQPLGKGQPGKRPRGKRQDVVMHALFLMPNEERAEARFGIAQQAGREWLLRQGATHGFALPGEVAVDGYETIRIPRAGARPAQFGVLDFDGVLEVTDPPRFLAALGTGFGRARAFGCGLMLIRRAP